MPKGFLGRALLNLGARKETSFAAVLFVVVPDIGSLVPIVTVGGHFEISGS
jgi:hypothetical protein